jgi:two-component system, OmpR family, response regulator
MKINIFGKNKKRILVVNCDDNLLSILKSRLIYAGFSVEVAADGAGAMELLRDRQPQLVLLDIASGGSDGLTVLYNIRNEKRLKGLTIFVMAPSDAMETIEKALHIGADDCIIKPFNPMELVGKIKKATGVK